MNLKRIIKPLTIVLLCLYMLPGVKASDEVLQVETDENTERIATGETGTEDKSLTEGVLNTEVPLEQIEETMSLLLSNPKLEELDLASPQPMDENGSIIIPEDGTLLNVRIPEKIGEITLFSIDSFAFDGTTCLRSITIPSTFTEIGEGAFANCPGLEYIVLEGRTDLDGLTLGENWNGDAEVIFALIVEEEPEESEPAETEPTETEPTETEPTETEPTETEPTETETTETEPTETEPTETETTETEPTETEPTETEPTETEPTETEPTETEPTETEPTETEPTETEPTETEESANPES